MRLNHLPRFHHYRNAVPARTHNFFPRRRHGQQYRNRRAFFGRVAIGQQNHRRLSDHRLGDVVTNPLDRRLRALHSVRRVKSQINDVHRAQQQIFQDRGLSRIQHRRIDHQIPAQVYVERHHVRFAQRIDGRIGDLREPLLAVIPQRPPRRGKVSRRRVVAHAPARFFRIVRQRMEQQTELIVGPAHRCRHFFRRNRRGRRRGEFTSHPGHVAVHPSIQFVAAAQLINQFAGAAKYSAVRRINHQNFARAQPVPLDNFFAAKIGQPHFRPADQQPIAGQYIAHRPQPIAVELGADHPPVAEDQRRRAIPRFLIARRPAQERPQFLRHLAVRFPRGRHQSQQRFGQRKTLAQQQLDGIVQTGRVAYLFFERVKTIVGAKLFPQSRFARMHPAPVRADRVDFAIVRAQPKRLRQLPGRTGVRRIALMKNGEGRGEFRVGQIGIKRTQLHRGKQSFVDHNCGRKRTKIDTGLVVGFQPFAHQK